jgi:hypothetical protein
MKAIEILAESKKIDEAPASTLGNIGRRLGAGVLGAMGLNTWAKGLNDKADIGTFSNRYYREFQSYLKSQGRTEQGATFADLKTFLDQNKIPSGRVPANTEGTVDAAMVNAILNRTATDFLKGTATAGASGAPSAPAQAQEPAQDTQQAPASQGASRRITATNPSGTFTPPAPQTQSGASIDNLISAVSRLKKADLQKLDQAVKAALTKPARPAAAQPGATAQPAPAPAQQTPAQIRADKQRTAAANAQAQMSANPAPAKAPVVTPQDAIAQTRATKQAAAAKNAQAQMASNPVPAKEPVKTPDQIRAEKQAVAAKMAQDQMAASPAAGPKVWKNNRNLSAPATSRPTKPKKAVAV